MVFELSELGKTTNVKNVIMFFPSGELSRVYGGIYDVTVDRKFAIDGRLSKKGIDYKSVRSRFNKIGKAMAMNVLKRELKMDDGFFGERNGEGSVG